MLLLAGLLNTFTYGNSILKFGVHMHGYMMYFQLFFNDQTFFPHLDLVRFTQHIIL